MYRLIYCLLAAAVCLASCDMMHEDREDCPYGLYVKFKYDYNMQRADMFDAHVQSVRLYIFDEQGRMVRTMEEGNSLAEQPLECPCYRMHITDLPAGRYQLLATALTPNPLDAPADYARRAKFRIAEPQTVKDLDILLDRQQTGPRLYEIENDSLPLDTLWHGMDLPSLRTGKMELIELSDTRPTYDTISLVRDTKQISVSLRELDDPTQMDINDYSLRIIDRNSHLLWDNAVDEADTVIYRPYATWNTDDKAQLDGSTDKIGKIGHADFMTSRLVYHQDAKEDAVLEIWKPGQSAAPIIRVNLVDMLYRLGNSSDTRRYSPQEFLDRGYDYKMTFFLKGGRLAYADIEISVLSWRIVFQSTDHGIK